MAGHIIMAEKKNSNKGMAEKYSARTIELLEPILSENKFQMVDVEYVTEGEENYLRIYIDKEGGISLDDCEIVSRAVELKLDEENLIKDPYILEVSSPGLTRKLKSENDFKFGKGKYVLVMLYKPEDIAGNGNKVKSFCGILEDFDQEKVVVSVDMSSLAKPAKKGAKKNSKTAQKKAAELLKEHPWDGKALVKRSDISLIRLEINDDDFNSSSKEAVEEISLEEPVSEDSSSGNGSFEE